MKRLIILIIAAALMLVFCGKKQDTRGIELNLRISPEPLTDSLYVKMDYDFKTGNDFKKIDKDYRVFVHFWRTNSKEMLIQDDHSPVKKTSEWSLSETVTYSRTLFIPQFLNEFDIDFEGYEEVKVTVGLYNPDPQTKESPIILYEKKMNIQPASINAPEIVYNEGWYELETDIKSTAVYEKSWRWTSQKGVCIIENPKKASTLIVKGGVNKAVFQDQKVALKINDTILDEFLPETAYFSQEYVVTPEMMGTNDEFSLKFETDKTFVPAKLDPNSKDNRELGIQVFFLYFREKSK
jgi:hypothetical protein